MKNTMNSAVKFVFLVFGVFSLTQGYGDFSYGGDDLDVQSTRPSKVGLGFGSGNDRYGTFLFFGDVGIDSTWSLQASFKGNRNATQLRSRELTVGADARFTRNFLTRINLLWNREPASIRGLGFSPGADYTISSLWRGDLKTVLTVNLSWERYVQSGSYPADKAMGRSSISQMGLNVAIRQEIMEIWWATLAGKAYRYGEGAAHLNTSVSRRRLFDFENGSFYTGFIKNQITLETDVKALEWLKPGISVTSTENVEGKRTNSMAVNLDMVFAQHWAVQPIYTYSKTNNTVGTDSIFALAGTFHW